jgi:hypothetical protein
VVIPQSTVPIPHQTTRRPDQALQRQIIADRPLAIGTRRKAEANQTTHSHISLDHLLLLALLV